MNRFFPRIATLISLLIFLSLALFTTCKKEDHSPSSDTTANSNGTELSAKDEDSLKYYIYEYMQVTIGAPNGSIKIPQYFWYKDVPSLDPLSDNYPKAEDLLEKIISYPLNSQTNQPIDRYSFLDRTGQITNEIQNGQSGGGLGRMKNEAVAASTTVTGDMGFQLGITQDGQLYILYVYKNSSAGKQGVQRGWQITAINGNTNVNDEQLLNNTIFGAASADLKFKKTDGTSVNLTLTATNYALTPVLFDTVYTMSDNSKTGYFVFSQFVDVHDSDNNPTETKNELDNVFNKFKTAGVKNVIIDLRYNGGGSVNTAAYIDNQYAPSSTANKLMYTYVYNDKIMQNISRLSDFPESVYFSNTAGGLNLDHLFFITSRNTVSASELTLNNLRPYMDVQLVGDTTYGKPVGFLTWEIYDYDATGKRQHLADLYDINFETFNAQNQGGYFEGIVPDHLEETDYVNYNWGDLRDTRLAAIRQYIETGSYRTAAKARLSASPDEVKLAAPLKAPHHFTGMVNFRN